MVRPPLTPDTSRSNSLSRTFALLVKARDVVRSSGNPTPPVDVAKVAVLCGIRQVRTEPLAVRGELRRLNIGGYAVTLDARLSPQRRRFTLAHEIAHTLLLADTGTAPESCSEG